MSTSSEIQLHRVANPWKPIRQRKVDSDPEIYKTEELFWDVRALLNKITPQTFEDLSKDLYDLWARADTNNRADSVIDILFRKVCDEPTFAELYASLCSGLCAHQVTFPPPQDCGINTFNFLLLMKCQKNFEEGKRSKDYREELMQEIANTQSDVEKKILKDNLEEKVNKYKWRIFGSIRFVGELYKFGLLTQYLAHICVHRLINKAQQFDEEVTQCLCQLLTNIGGKLENEKADVKNRVSGAYVEKYFEVLKSLQKDSRFCKRIQFEILNLIELREVHHWKPRRHKGGPKKLEELRADIELEKMADNFEFKFCGKRRDYERIGGTSYGLISSSNKFHTAALTYCRGVAPTQQQVPQRERHVLTIIDPTTNENISESVAAPSVVSPIVTDQPPFVEPPSQCSHEQHGHGQALTITDKASSNKREVTEIRKNSVEKVPVKDKQTELLRALKNKKATNAWFYDNPEGNRVYDSEYMFLLLKLPLSRQKPQFTTHLPDICMPDWENRAEKSFERRCVSVTTPNLQHNFAGRSTGTGPMLNFQVSWQAQQMVTMLRRTMASYGGRGRGSQDGCDRRARPRSFQQSEQTPMIIPSFSPSAEVQVCRTEKACEPTRQQNNGSDSDVLKTDSEENMKYYAVQLFVQYASFDEYTEAKRLIVKRRSHFTEMVAYILEYIVEKEDEERLKFANLLSKLYNDSIVDKEMLTDGFAKFVELCMDCDLVGDLRLIWDLLAVIISNIAKFSSSQGLSLSDFYSSFKAADHYKYVLFTKCLQKLVHLPVDEQKSAHGDFFTSGANYWSIFDFVDRSALIDDLKDKGISLPEFSPFAPLNNPNDNTTSNSVVNSWNNELITKALLDTVLVEMERLIKSMNPVDGDILIQYIVENVKNRTLSEDYAHALARCLCSNVFKMMHSDGESREIEELFGPCLPVFRRFFTGNKPLEKILLNTLCEVYYENQCPKDSLTSIFELLIMENVLPRDAFLDWWSLKQQCRAYDVVLRDLKLKTFVEELQHSI